MKKRVIGVLTAALIVTVGSMNVSAAGHCGRYTDASRSAACAYKAGCSYVDENGDGICDNCKFTDENGDGICDNCKFTDENGDGICDNCNYRVKFLSVALKK